MNALLRIFFTALLLLPGLLQARTLQVVVAVRPLQTFVEQVGGSAVTVQSLVREGFDPHHYEPSPQQISQLAGADLYFSLGMPSETLWLKRLRAVNPEMEVVPLHEDQEPEVHDHTGEHEHEHEQDPHIWTSPAISKQLIRKIEQTLSARLPDQRAEFQARSKSYLDQLSTLEQELMQQLQSLRNRTFMVFHPAWGHFAAQFGLRQLSIEFEGKEPGPRTLARLINEAQQQHLKLVLVQPQFSPQAAQQIARAIGGRVEVADALAADYITNLHHLADILLEANR